MKTTQIEPHKSSLGMDANVASLIIYIAMAVVSWIPFLGWLSWAVPLAFFFMEKNSAFVKFQAVQALIIGIIRAAIAVILYILVWILRPKDLFSAFNYALGKGWGVWMLLGTISTIIGLAITALIIFLIIMAYGYKRVELPIIGPIAAKASEKLDSINIKKPENESSENKSE
ncbi:MAG: hypothetical protein FWG27_03470 [Treponema sp.]|nr:hypothetical protein [Treponema sp.]